MNFVIENHSESEIQEYINNLKFDIIEGKDQNGNDCISCRFVNNLIIETGVYKLIKQGPVFLYLSELAGKELYFFKQLDQFAELQFTKLCEEYTHKEEENNEFNYDSIVKNRDNTEYIKLRYDDSLEILYQDKKTDRELEKNKTRVRAICRIIEIIRTKDHGYVDVITDKVNIEVELIKNKPITTSFSKQNKPTIQVRKQEDEYPTIISQGVAEEDMEIKAVDKITYPRTCATCGKEYKTQKTFETHSKKCG
jgi:hypothetical protein